MAFVNSKRIYRICLWQAYVQKVILADDGKTVDVKATSHGEQHCATKRYTNVVVVVVDTKVSQASKLQVKLANA